MEYGQVEDVIPMSGGEAYPSGFPAIGEWELHPAPMGHLGNMVVQSRDPVIDRISEGQNGEVDRNSYGFGPTDPKTVENFDLYGQVLIGQRRPEYGSGPVGQTDHGAYTTMQVMQQVQTYAYDEASLLSLLTEGV